MNNMQSYYDAPDEGGGGGDASWLGHLPNVILQRKWLFIVPALLGLLAGVAAAFLLPVKYDSHAVLLVEAPLLPDDVATDTSGTELVDQRMARIRQQVLSRPQLIELIRRNNLYQSELQTGSLSDVIDEMRNSISIDPITADIQTSRSGQRSTIAFSLSFHYSDPVKVQAVAQALTDQVLSIDSTKSAEQATNTVQFLSDQADNLLAGINGLQQQISQITASNGLALSGGATTFMTGGSSASLDAQIASLQQANSQLNAQLAAQGTADTRDPIVQQAESALAIARATYSDSHPDVIQARQRLAQAKALAKKNQSNAPLNTINAQITFNNKQISMLQAAKSQDAARTSQVLAAQATAPAVREKVSQLQQKLDLLNAQYQRASTQLLAARAGKKADDENQGERLSMVDPPVIPQEPVSPNRPKLIGLGTFGGLALGLALIVGLEFLYRPIRTPGAVTDATGQAPLVVIPVITAKDERKGGFLSRLWPFGGSDDDDDDDG